MANQKTPFQHVTDTQSYAPEVIGIRTSDLSNAAGVDENQTWDVGPPSNSVIMIGGVDLQSLDPDVPGRCVFQLHTDSHEWEELGSLDEYTHHHGAAVVGGNLYVVGKL